MKAPKTITPQLVRQLYPCPGLYRSFCRSYPNGVAITEPNIIEWMNRFGARSFEWFMQSLAGEKVAKQIHKKASGDNGLYAKHCMIWFEKQWG